jgi:hypothetical protein
VALVTGPSERGILADLLSILRFNERIVLLFSNDGRATSGSTLGITAIHIAGAGQVRSASIMLDQQPHDLLVTVTGSPQQRVPPVSLARRRGLFCQPVSRLVIVVLLAGLKKQLVFLLLLQLFHDLFLVVIVVTPAGTTSSS